jgi:AraC family transcriptional regulator, transcriptional activator of pobA
VNSRETKKILTFNTEEFLERFMQPDLKFQNIIKKDYGRFFIVRVQDMIKVSKLPVPPTRALSHTLIYLTKGEATMKVGSQCFLLRKNQCLFVPAGQVFSYDKYEVNEGFLCNFSDDIIIGKFGNNELVNEFEFLAVWGNPLVEVDEKRGRYIVQTLQRIFDDYTENGLNDVNIIQSYFVAFLHEINCVYQPLLKNAQPNSIAIINKFKELLFANIQSKHLVTDYASLLNVSPNHLNKVVKKNTGKSPTKWIDETIVLEAKVLLYQTNLCINEISAAIGIYDQSYFSRLFKKYEGITPLEFRKMIEMS